MPAVVITKEQPESIDTVQAVSGFVPELVGRMCKLEEYSKIKPIKPFNATQSVIAYASPDSTFAATKRLFDQAKQSILIGIYDFSADHVKELVLAAMRRGVKVELMLDIDSQVEKDLFDELEHFGATCTPAPSCASKRAHYFRSSHEKVIVIDNEWCLVQSGNYSDNSIPLNVDEGENGSGFVTGNRDMGLAVRSKPLAKFFRKVLEADIALELKAPEMLAGMQTLPETFLVERAPRKRLAKVFASKEFKLKAPLALQPILSPDNYMKEIPELLRSATNSVWIQQQYIRASQPQIQILLRALAEAKANNKKLDVKIVLGKIFGGKDVEKEAANLRILSSEYGLKLGKHIRYVDTDRLVHCHNKLIVVDGATVLVSSQNWSDAAVTENREAGLLFTHRGLANYYSQIFELDWSTAKKAFGPSGPEMLRPEAFHEEKNIRVVAADYV